MPIDPLGPAAALLAALRGEMAGKAERAGRVEPKRVQTPPQQRTDKDKAGLRQALAQIADEANVDDEEGMRSIRRRMVRSMLVWEFGPALREHPQWQPLLESVTRTLEESPTHCEAFTALVGQLRR